MLNEQELIGFSSQLEKRAFVGSTALKGMYRLLRNPIKYTKTMTSRAVGKTGRASLGSYGKQLKGTAMIAGIGVPAGGLMLTAGAPKEKPIPGMPRY